MIWQDMVLSVANILFAYALIPQVYQGFKKRKGFMTLQTSLITTLGLLATSITLFTLKLYYSSTITIITTTLWFTLLMQRIAYGK